MTSNDNISIRTRIRKASTSINPEFGPATEALLTFVSSHSSWHKRSDNNASIVLSPLSLLAGTPPANNNNNSSNNNNGGNNAWRSASPLRSHSAPRARGLSSSQRNRSFNRNHPPLMVVNKGGGQSQASVTDLNRRPVSPANVGSSDNINCGLELDLSNDDKLTHHQNDMVDISLEDEKPITIELESNNNEEEARQDTNNTLPPSQQRHSTSPLPIVRSGSGLSMPAIIGGLPHQQLDVPPPHHPQQPQTRGSINSTSSTNSHNSRSRSNSLPRSRSINDRSRSINKSMRARSRNRNGGSGGDSLCSSTGRQRTTTSRSRAGSSGRPLSRGNTALCLSGRRMRSAGAANVFNTISVVCNDDEGDGVLDSSRLDEENLILEEMSVALRDVISVRMETPSSSNSGANGATTSSSMAPVAMTRVGSFTLPTSPPTPLYRPGSKLSTTTQSLSASHPTLMTNSYRIYIHTRMNGYLELDFDKNCNSYEVVLAYLRCHLREGMVPPDPTLDGSGKKKGLEESVGLAKTKSITPKHAAKDGSGDEETVTSTSTASISSQHQPPPTPTEPPQITRSNSSNPIERLQTKAINRQLEQESTPMNRLSGWLSSIVDCGFNCCQDTTVTPEDKTTYYYGGSGGIQSTTPLRESTSGQSVTPRSRVLKKSGIGGLSFEVETVTSNMSGY